MLEKAIVEHCAPTLAGLKTGKIFCLKSCGKDLTPEIRAMNTILVKRGLRLIPLRRTQESILIYLYRPEDLCSDLVFPDAERILEEKGYPCGKPGFCIVELIRRLVTESAFPHEIGLFLGYPPSDVRQFINSPWDGVKCVGCWKAYGNEAEAVRTFDRFRKCTESYRRAVRRGVPLEKLIVDTRNGRRMEAPL